MQLRPPVGLAKDSRDLLRQLLARPGRGVGRALGQVVAAPPPTQVLDLVDHERLLDGRGPVEPRPHDLLVEIPVGGQFAAGLAPGLALPHVADRRDPGGAGQIEEGVQVPLDDVELGGREVVERFDDRLDVVLAPVVPRDLKAVVAEAREELAEEAVGNLTENCADGEHA